MTAHVRSGSRLKTQYISTTRSAEVAESYAARDGCTIVCVDLNKFGGNVFDLTSEANRAHYLTNPIARN
jgi:hypothetical protein